MSNLDDALRILREALPDDVELVYEVSPLALRETSFDDAILAGILRRLLPNAALHPDVVFDRPLLELASHYVNLSDTEADTIRRILEQE